MKNDSTIITEELQIHKITYNRHRWFNTRLHIVKVRAVLFGYMYECNLQFIIIYSHDNMLAGNYATFQIYILLHFFTHAIRICTCFTKYHY